MTRWGGDITPQDRFLPRSARDRLAEGFKDQPSALVLSGHVHQYRLLRAPGARAGMPETLVGRTRERPQFADGDAATDA
jgi:hypothetical protein